MANKKVNEMVEVVEETTENKEVNEEKIDEIEEQIECEPKIVSKKEKFIEKAKPIVKGVGKTVKNILAGVGGLCVAAYVVGKAVSGKDMDSDEKLKQICYEKGLDLDTDISSDLSNTNETTDTEFTELNTD